jgi:hypothetical protein
MRLMVAGGVLLSKHERPKTRFQRIKATYLETANIEVCEICNVGD